MKTTKNSVEFRGEKEYNQEPRCPLCGNFEFVKKYKCDDCGEVHDADISCPCKWNYDNKEIEVCETCGEVIK